MFFFILPSEFLASEDPSLFWRYLDSISTLVAEDKLAPTEDGEAVLAAALSMAKSRLSDGHVALLELALASRAYSAAIEMNNQLSSAAVANFSTFPCPPGAKFWIAFAGRPICTVEALRTQLKSAVGGGAEGPAVAELRLRSDKVFGRSPGQARVGALPSAVLYGDLRYKEMYAAHVELKAASQAGKVEYVFRHRIVVSLSLRCVDIISELDKGCSRKNNARHAQLVLPKLGTKGSFFSSAEA